MNLSVLEAELAALGENYKTADLDRLNKKLIKSKADVSFLKELLPEKDRYHRTYFQVSLAALPTLPEKLAFIEDNFDKLNDWWHVDQLPQFIGNDLGLDFAEKKARSYIKSPLPFVRRWGYVMFMPNLVKEKHAFEHIIPLLRDDEKYYVVMAEAWLISYLAVYEPEKTLKYLASCPLKYNIAGRAIQKICDSFRIDTETKEKFKALRVLYKKEKI